MLFFKLSLFSYLFLFSFLLFSAGFSLSLPPEKLFTECLLNRKFEILEKLEFVGTWISRRHYLISFSCITPAKSYPPQSEGHILLLHPCVVQLPKIYRYVASHCLSIIFFLFTHRCKTWYLINLHHSGNKIFFFKVFHCS